MVHVGSSFFAVAERPLLPGAGPELGPTVVWLQGEHDIATDFELSQVLAGAAAANDAAVVVDLSEVEFISASTIGVIVRARELTRQRSRSLTVRSPSAFVRYILGICGLDDLFGPNVQAGDAVARNALSSWVEVPLSAPDRVLEPYDGAAGLRTDAVIVVQVAEMALERPPAVGGSE